MGQIYSILIKYAQSIVKIFEVWSIVCYSSWRPIFGWKEILDLPVSFKTRDGPQMSASVGKITRQNVKI